MPHAGVVLVLSLGEPFRVGFGDGVPEPLPGFMAGLHDRHATVESDGRAECVQVNLTLPAAVRLAGMPLAELANRTVAVDDVLGRWSRELTGQLAETRSWAARLALAEAAVARRIEQAPPLAGDLALALRRLQASDGAAGIAGLAREIGCSRKHLTTRFRAALGLPPKTLARILRFVRLTERLDATGGAGWADLAAQAGYFDQPHLSREVRAFTGLPPGAWLAQRHVYSTG
ncbi:MAG: helix-turn-helix domain-containing protein [Geminicoccaceae bacterium]